MTLDGAPAGGDYDLRFRLFDASNGGNQVGSTFTVVDVAVGDGYFTVQLDFGTEAFAMGAGREARNRVAIPLALR